MVSEFEVPPPGWSAVSNGPADGDAIGILFQGFRHFLERVDGVRRGDVGWHSEMHVWLQRAHALFVRGEMARDAFDLWRRGWGAAFCAVSTCQGLAWARGNGLGLDHAVVDRIESRWTATEAELAKWDDFFHADPAIRAVRHRREHCQSCLTRRDGRAGIATGWVLDLGCGPGWAIGTHFAAQPASPWRFVAVDGDPAALERAREVCGGGASRVEFVTMDPTRYLPAPGRMEMIWSGGMLERLGDRQAVMVIRRLWDALPPGGEVILGNLGTANPSRAYLELVLGWLAYPRSRDDLLALAAQAGIPAEVASVESDPSGVGLYLHLSQRPSLAGH